MLFFILLPPGHVPAAKHASFRQPTEPYVDVRDDRLFICYAVTGPAVVQFWVRELEDGDALQRYDLNRLLDRKATSTPKLAIELNLGIVKIKVGG